MFCLLIHWLGPLNLKGLVFTHTIFDVISQNQYGVGFVCKITSRIALMFKQVHITWGCYYWLYMTIPKQNQKICRVGLFLYATHPRHAKFMVMSWKQWTQLLMSWSQDWFYQYQLGLIASPRNIIEANGCSLHPVWFSLTVCLSGHGLIALCFMIFCSACQTNFSCVMRGTMLAPKTSLFLCQIWISVAATV